MFSQCSFLKVLKHLGLVCLCFSSAMQSSLSAEADQQARDVRQKLFDTQKGFICSSRVLFFNNEVYCFSSTFSLLGGLNLRNKRSNWFFLNWHFVTTLTNSSFFSTLSPPTLPFCAEMSSLRRRAQRALSSHCRYDTPVQDDARGAAAANQSTGGSQPAVPRQTR